MDKKSNTKELHDFTIRNPDGIEEEDLKFIFHQAEKRLEESIKIFDYSINKTYILLSTSIALITTLTGYFFNEFSFYGEPDPLLITIFFILFYLYYIIYILSNNLKSVDYRPIGSDPKFLLNEAFYKSELTKPLNEIYYSELVNYSKRIRSNFNENEKKTAVNDKSLKLLIFLPIASILLFLLIGLCLWFFNL